MHNRFQIAQEFANEIRNDEIIQIILFGSVARGDDEEDSDIDILIVLPKINKTLKSLIDEKVVDYILEKEEMISPHIMTENHLIKQKITVF